MALYGFKHLPGAVSPEDAARARTYLKTAWGAARGLHPADPHPSLEGTALINAAREGGALFEWPDVWLDAAGSVQAITSHAYGLTPRDLQAALNYGEAHGFEVRIEGHGSWKSAGHTVIVEYLRWAVAG